MGLREILFGKPMTSTAPDFLGTKTTDYRKIKAIAETILESQTATREQRQKANKWLGECNKVMK